MNEKLMASEEEQLKAMQSLATARAVNFTYQRDGGMLCFARGLLQPCRAMFRQCLLRSRHKWRHPSLKMSSVAWTRNLLWQRFRCATADS